MAEHYPKNTVEVSAFCKRCVKDTPHNVNGGRLGGCKSCIARLDAEQKARVNVPAPAEQSEMKF